MQNPIEFQLIARHFAPLAGAGALGLLDDGAVLAPPPGRELIFTADAIVEGVHFRADDPPATVAQKLLRVNLSDIAAMGGEPLAYLLTISVPSATPDAWFAAFAEGLGQDQQKFGLSLLGGDTTSTPGPKSLTATLIGHVAPGMALRRAGAQPGDTLWITGTIGDAALGLAALQGKIADPTGYLAHRYHVPQPRLGFSLHGLAHACIDVSDGLLQDTMHLCRAAGLALTLDVAKIPLSDAARPVADTETILTSGDDYELLFAAPDSATEPILQLGVRVTAIGTFKAGPSDVELLHCDWKPTSRPGWSHF